MTYADNSIIRYRAAQHGVALGDAVLDALQSIGATALGICPNSEAVLGAAIKAAKQSKAPVFLAATLNQVDSDGGYTGWTQKEFVTLTRRLADAYSYDGPIVVGLDHGGPWLKDKHAREQLSLADALAAVRASLAADLEAGYDLLHIDPTVDRSLPVGQSPAIETVVERTVNLIEYAERTRLELGLPPVTYEVGTEEIHGGIAQPSAFRHFLEILRQGLSDHGLRNVWPKFVVGAVGTDLHTTDFNPEVASQVVTIAAEYGSLVKGHYTDCVSNPEAYPATGMGGANVGPEFTEAEYEALAELAVEEEARITSDKVAEPSRMMAVLEEAVVSSGRWEKWRQPDELNKPFNELGSDRREWLVRTGCRYIWATPEVVAARQRLYANAPEGPEAAKNRVLDTIGDAIRKYFDAFNLTGSLKTINEWLKD